MEKIEVVRRGNLQSGGTTPGIVRERAFDSGQTLFSKSTIAPGTISAWHHHGSRQLYGFVVSGTLRLELSEKGEAAVDVSDGDFFRIPPGLVHRDVNIGSAEVVIVNLLLGEGNAVVNVNTP
jgi:quercetin dioxygenase-like cupin family protein